MAERFYDWTLISGLDCSTANGKGESTINPITGQKFLFYGLARKELPASHWIFNRLYEKNETIKDILGLNTVYDMYLSYDDLVKKSFLVVGYHKSSDILIELEKIDRFIINKPENW